jgi:hypothetical protein
VPFVKKRKKSILLRLHVFVSSDEGSGSIKMLSSTVLENCERPILSFKNCSREIAFSREAKGEVVREWFILFNLELEEG